MTINLQSPVTASIQASSAPSSAHPVTEPRKDIKPFNLVQPEESAGKVFCLENEPSTLGLVGDAWDPSIQKVEVGGCNLGLA